jgi:hypothetical protein
LQNKIKEVEALKTIEIEPPVVVEVPVKESKLRSQF